MNQYQEKVSHKLGDSVTCLDLSIGGSYFAAGLLNESVVLWKGAITKENEENIRLEGHGLGVIDILFSDDESKLAVSSLDSVIRIWDMEQSVKLREITCEQMDNWKIVFFDNQTICTAGQGGKVSLYDCLSGQELKSFSVENSFATAIHNNQHLLAVCTDSGSLHLVEDQLDKHKLFHLPKLHKKMIRTVKFSADGSRTLTGSDDQEIKLVDLNQMKCIRTFFGHQGNVNQIDINPVDPKIFASCSYDGYVKLWDTSSGQCIDTFQPFEKKVDCIWGLKFNFDGTLIGICNQAGGLSFYSH